MTAIAIVGRACLLPGASSPEALYELAHEGRDALTDVPAGRWRVPEAHVLIDPDAADTRDKTWTKRGGYVEGFRFDADGYRVAASELRPLDPLFQWVLDTGRRALVDADVLSDATRTGAILGNLSLPSAGQSAFAEETWLGALARRAGIAPQPPSNRHNSGLPAHLLAQALGLEAPSYALDAACASSLYAVELACRELSSGRADRMLAGAVNRADDLFIHVGFCALGAMSRSGRSRPFHAGADGLVSAEGCGFVVLERLEDAVRAGRTIHGVIRGVGLSNDGRSAGLLAPSAGGQARSMRLALEAAKLTPSDVPYIECHATGTPVGDGVELSSMAAVYDDGAERRIGSLKANLGHLITAAGVAGLIKVLESIRHETVLPTPHLDRPSDALSRSRFVAPTHPEPWRGPRRAGVSAFGFGGNNAHLIVEAHHPATQVSVPERVAAAVPTVLVRMGARVGAGRSITELQHALAAGEAFARAERVELPFASLKFPPTDLQKASGQQTLLLAAALEATDGLRFDQDRTGIFVGYQCDPEISRWGARWRMRSFGEALSEDESWIARAKDACVAPLEAAHVVGTLPNVPANRLSSQLDLCGPSYTVSAEELSGIRALITGLRSIERGELDAAIVGAVDLSSEPVHERALGESDGGDAAVALVLMRRDHAERDGLEVLAELDVDTAEGSLFGATPDEAARSPRAHAAFGLLRLVEAILLCRTRGDDSLRAVQLDSLGGQRARVAFRALSSPEPRPASAAPALTLPAHPPPVRLPDSTRPAMQKMQPAPTLPPVTAKGSRPVTERAPVHAAAPAQLGAGGAMARPASAIAQPRRASTAMTPAAATTLSAASMPAVSMPGATMPIAHVPVSSPAVTPADAWLSTFAAQQQMVAQAHRAFVSQQATVHRRFLEGLMRPPGAAPAAKAPVPAAPSPSQPTMGSTPPSPTSARSHALPIVPADPPPAAAPVHARAPVLPPPAPSSPAVGPALAKPAVSSPAVAEPVVAEPAAKPASVEETPLAFRPRGRTFNREQLVVHSGGVISEIFGPQFEQQDRYAVQVRMPEPPLLLADRVTGIEAEPGSMKKGICWTETDVREDSWYLHQGHMPAGVMVESGQADLFLISYLGVDFHNRGERAYRLLGCEMTWQGDLPAVGETLVYDIHVDGHAAQGDVRLFFFHYDCHIRRADGSTRPALKVRNGQAGFFTTGELAESAGILWRPETQEIIEDARVDPPSVPFDGSRSYDREAIEAFAAGEPWRCFGEGFLRTRTHTRTPRIQEGRMLFLDTVEVLDPQGGPWGRGYLKAVTPIRADEWFFDGHFKNDPCMPGTLMLEGCVQAMAFYLSALGYTVERDGWRFVPVEEATYALRCRGQVTPESKELTYEIFIEEVHDGPEPVLYADLLCTVDGLGAFHARRFGLRLKPSWPLAAMPELTRGAGEDPRCATASYKGGPEFRFDYPSLLACAWGQPSTAFGPMYERFDGVRRCARLPGPPYHFLSRVTSVDGEIGGLEVGTKIAFDYDVPEDAWYFDENGARVMPFAVLLEAALQPCGWTASYVGSALSIDSDLLFRNLDGKGTIKAEVFEDSGTFHTEVEITNISQSAGMIIESFRVRCYLGETEVYELDTVFGFFPPSAFDNQQGLPIGDRDRALFDAAQDVRIDLTKPRYQGTLRPANPMLLMIDRVTHFDPKGGEAGLGTLRAEKDVDPDEWFFKAHFYQDPVQPGSLGIEAMLQLLQVYMLETNLGEGFERPRFEGIATDREHVWKYRGQVVPKNRVITTTLEITETGRDERGVFAIGRASLWVDGKRIYESSGLGMRIVEGGVDPEERLDPSKDTWLKDHCPTHTLPALPMMSMVDRMVGAARDTLGECDGLSDVRVERWVVLEGETRVRTEVVEADGGHEVLLSVWRDARNPALSRFEVAARAKVERPAEMGAIAPLGPSESRVPYGDDRLFHGPAFQMMTSLQMGQRGSTAILDAGKGGVPFGRLNQGLLDAATHGIPHDSLSQWSDRIGEDVIGYPSRLDLRFDGPAPRSSEVRCEARFVGFEDDDARFPITRVQLTVGDHVFCDMRLTEILMPKGRLGAAAPADRRRFLRDGEAVPGVGLSVVEGGRTELRVDEVRQCDWLPGTVRYAYDVRGDDLAREVAIKEHVARRLSHVHPRSVLVDGDDARSRSEPLVRHRVAVEASPQSIVVVGGEPTLDLQPIADFWRAYFDVGPWPVEDLYYGLVERFVAGFHLEDPDAFEALRGHSVLYLGNHQVGIESLIFSIVGSALQGVPTLTLAKTEHRESWLGKLIAHCFTWPGVSDPGVITYFDRSDPTSLPTIAKELADRTGARSLMVHVEGTRAHQARQPVQTMSGIFCDLAIQAGVPIVPIRFTGGLPLEPSADKLEYPYGMGKQDYWLGAPIDPATLAARPYKERTELVLERINRLGPSVDEEVPGAPDPEFEARVHAYMKERGTPIGLATLVEVLEDHASSSEEARRLLEAVASPSEAGDDPRGAWRATMARMLRAE